MEFNNERRRVMTRIARIKFANPEDGYYHIVSRTTQQSFMLGDIEKEKLSKEQIKRLQQLLETKHPKGKK